MLLMNTIVVVKDQQSPGFYSRCMVLDLTAINKYIPTEKFKMETMERSESS